MTTRLSYSADDQPGIRRLRCGRGFTYRDPDGATIRDRRERRRIESLAVPPAWQGVWICLRSDGHLQATGRDARERKQYRYHPAWREFREAKKFDQLLPFADKLPRLRSAVAEDLERDDLSREHVTAAAVRLLETSCIRVGNDVYRRRNGTYGLTTLRRRHLALEGSSLRLSFRAKGGVRQEVEVDDPRVAATVRACHELPGQDLFVWRDEHDQRHGLTSDDVNEYLRERTGLDVTAKVFRLWMGTLHAFSHLLDLDRAESDHQANRQFLEAVDVARDSLRNTRAVCRASYLHPALEECHRSGSLVELADYGSARASKWLDREEVALKRVLREWPSPEVDVELVRVPAA